MFPPTTPSQKPSPAPEPAVHVLIRGRVQGVGFRYFVQASAQAAHVTGWVRNLPSGDVEAMAQGPRAILEIWVETLKKGPPLSRVDRLQVEWTSMFHPVPDFRIR